MVGVVVVVDAEVVCDGRRCDVVYDGCLSSSRRDRTILSTARVIYSSLSSYGKKQRAFVCS